MKYDDLKQIARKSKTKTPGIVSGISVFTRSLTKRRFLWFSWWVVGKPVRA